MQRVVLRHVRDEGGLRYLQARLTDAGDLVFSGQEIGVAVERFWGEGMREYEWVWTVKKAHVPALASALGTTEAELLAALTARFAHPRSDEIQPFLRAHAIPFEPWSRVGE
jgi:hypothetical protein